jgi:predicted P-loop ATPase/GTPase
MSHHEPEIGVLMYSGLSLSEDAGGQKIFKDYLYELDGNRIELCNPVVRLLLAPDWRTITWTQAEHAMARPRAR